MDEEHRYNVRGTLWVEGGGVEKKIDVDDDYCPDCFRRVLDEGYVVIPLEQRTEIDFDG